MAPPPDSLPARFPRLDGVRGLAILLVLLHQFSQLDVPTGFLGRVVDLVLDRGWVGVQLFFVLSGFLITGILVDARGTPGAWRHFIQRRALRILPLYFGALLVFTQVLPAVGVAPAGWRDQSLWYWLFVSNWTQASLGGALPHFWSLAVEEQFYLLWPFVALLWERSRVLWACVAIVLMAFAARLAMRHAGVSPEAVYMSTLSRMDALACGAIAALGIRHPGVRSRLGAHAILGWSVVAALLAGGFAVSHFDRTSVAGQVVGYPALAVAMAIAILLLAAADLVPSRGAGLTHLLATRPMRLLGRYSFAMYVFHKPMHDLIGRPILVSLGYPAGLPLGVGIAYVAAAIAATAAVGALSYHAFERHFLAMGRPHRAGPGGGSGI